MTISRSLSFDEVQEHLRAYDRKYWRHGSGGPTVRHAYTHLRLSLKKLLKRLPRQERLHMGWDTDRVRGHVAAGVLLECAFRLASDAGFTLSFLLTRPPGPSTIREWIEETLRGGAYERIADWYLEFNIGLEEFEQAIERSEHEEPLEIGVVHSVTVHLTRFALLAARCGEQEFLGDLELRIGANSAFVELTRG